MNENIFRILTAIFFFTGIGISVYFRREADQESGEKVSRSGDGMPIMTIVYRGHRKRTGRFFPKAGG